MVERGRKRDRFPIQSWSSSKVNSEDGFGAVVRRGRFRNLQLVNNLQKGSLLGSLVSVVQEQGSGRVSHDGL